jgi:hypothetical protein
MKKCLEIAFEGYLMLLSSPVLENNEVPGWHRKR